MTTEPEGPADEDPPPYELVLADTVDRITQLIMGRARGESDILNVLTDGMWWVQQGPGCSCTEAEAIAAAAVLLGADIDVMADLVVTGHGQPDRSEEYGDDHWHQGGPEL
jgi:hypothetical protein